MTVLFWVCLATIAYAYFGYPLALGLYALLRSRPLRTGLITPGVTIIIAAHNEEKRLPAKLANLSALQYPAERLDVVIASDGSTDRTAEILHDCAVTQPRMRLTLVDLAQPVGKAGALNEAVLRATGEILVFLDVRQSVDPNAIAELVSCFADDSVGAVSGELHLETPDGKPSSEALGIYWKLEKMVRRLESRTGSVVGATGAIYAIRRALYVEIPQGTLLDDVFVPMQVARAGKRVVFQPAAIARDVLFPEPGKEFSRKVRTLTGNYQLIQLAPWLLSPANPLLFRLISHKLLRLAVPLFLLLMLVASAAAGGLAYRVILVLQLAFYGLALMGFMLPASRRNKVISIATTFVMLNVAATVAFDNVVTGRENVWNTRTGSDVPSAPLGHRQPQEWK